MTKIEQYQFFIVNTINSKLKLMNKDTVPKGDREASGDTEAPRTSFMTSCMPLAAKDTRAIIDVDIDELWAYLYDAYIAYCDKLENHVSPDNSTRSHAYYSLITSEDISVIPSLLDLKKNFLKELGNVLHEIIIGHQPIIDLIIQYSNFYPGDSDVYHKFLRVWVSKLKNYEALIMNPQKTYCRFRIYEDILGKPSIKIDDTVNCLWNFTAISSRCTCGQSAYVWATSHISEKEWLQKTDNKILGCMIRQNFDV